MSVIIGCDPGLHGAIAVLDQYGELVDVHDMPVVGADVSPAGVNALIAPWGNNDLTVVVELVAGYSPPGRRAGGNGMFKFGKSYGVVLGVVAANAMRVEHVTPARWKKDMGVTSDKETSRARAINRWPKWHASFARKKDADRAEAALIALWRHEHP
jgi:hypothetical protein